MGDVTAYHPGWVYHGLVVGTAEDGVQLLWSLLSGQPLNEDTIGQMITPRALPRCRSDLHPDTTHELGPMLSSTAPEMHPVGHSGEGPGSGISVYGMDGVAAVALATEASGLDTEGLTLKGLPSGR